MANTARVAALGMLAARRLTEAQLWKKLEARGYADDSIADAISGCKREGYLDDRLFAALYVEGPRKAVGDARLVAELVKRGIDREAAQRAVSAAPSDQTQRITTAYEKLLRTKGDLSYQSAARALERLGFPTPLIYRLLREHAAAAFADALGADGAGTLS
jgi:SOS response regulatory protein OraA/RecX